MTAVRPHSSSWTLVETDVLHLPVLVTNLKCAIGCSWQDPARLHPRPGGLVLVDAAFIQSKTENLTSHSARHRNLFRDNSPWRQPPRLSRPRLVYSFSYVPHGTYHASGVT